VLREVKVLVVTISQQRRGNLVKRATERAWERMMHQEISRKLNLRQRMSKREAGDADLIRTSRYNIFSIYNLK